METAEKLITENLNVWTSVIKIKSSAGRGSGKKRELYGVGKLRGLILELAVNGMLVPQNSNDEPAEHLLKRIVAIRNTQIAEGKIKKAAVRQGKFFPPQTRRPKSWESTTLGTIGDWGSGSTPKRDNPGYYGGDITWLKSGELNDCETVASSSETITDEALASGSFRRNQSSDVLIAMYGATIGKVAILAEPAVTNQAVCGCTPFDGVFNRYLFFFLLSQRSNFHAASEGGAQPNISKVKLLGYPFAIPPLAEQHRIVAKVDELMALCDQLEQEQTRSLDTHDTLVATLLGALTTATADASQFAEAWQRIHANFDTLFTTESSIDQFKQAILQLAVMGKLVEQDPADEAAATTLERIATQRAELIKAGDLKNRKLLPPISKDEEPSKLPDPWQWCRLDVLITDMDAGWSPACPPTPSPSHDIWGVLKTTAVQVMEYREIENKVLDGGKSPRPQYEVRSGDILITRAGPKNRVGISCLVENTRPRLMISDKIIRFHLVEVGITERFISLCLNAGPTWDYLENAKSGMAKSQMNISQGKLRAAPIPLAPLDEQHRIVAKVDELMTLCDQLKASLATAQATQLNLADSLVEQAIG